MLAELFCAYSKPEQQLSAVYFRTPARQVPAPGMETHLRESSLSCCSSMILIHHSPVFPLSFSFRSGLANGMPHISFLSEVYLEEADGLWK